jgi:hypothetical protein
METIRHKFNDQKCRTCVYRQTLSGTHHLGCSKSMLNPGVITALVQINDHSFNNGWASWPFDFDPIWIDSCDSHLQKEIIPFETREEYMKELQKLIQYLMNKMEFLKNKDPNHAILLGNNISDIITKLQHEDSKENLQIAYEALLKI